MSSDKRTAFLRFILLYVAGFALVIIVFSAYVTTSPATAKNDSYSDLFTSNEALNNDLSKLYKLNEKYLTTLSFPLRTATRDSILRTQASIIKPIKEKIAYLVKAGDYYDDNIKKRYQTTAALHENSLNNWQTVNTFILFEGGSNAGVSARQESAAVAPIKAEKQPEVKVIYKEVPVKVMVNDGQVASLQKQLKAAQQKASANNGTLQKNADEIKFLKWAVRSQVAQIKALENKLKN